MKLRQLDADGVNDSGWTFAMSGRKLSPGDNHQLDFLMKILLFKDTYENNKRIVYVIVLFKICFYLFIGKYDA